MSPAKAAPAVRFEATLYAIDGSTILRLPEKAVTSCRPVARWRSRRLSTGTRARPADLSKNGKLIDPR